MNYLNVMNVTVLYVKSVLHLIVKFVGTLPVVLMGLNVWDVTRKFVTRVQRNVATVMMECVHHVRIAVMTAMTAIANYANGVFIKTPTVKRLVVNV